jgi:hypothetical protein
MTVDTSFRPATFASDNTSDYSYEAVRQAQIVDELVRTSQNVPDDILALIARILIDENATKVPLVIFRQSRSGKTTTTGRCFYEKRIVLTAGSSLEKTVWVTIHEMTHWLTTGEQHSPFFYERAFELYERYGCDMDRILAWESNYKSYAAKMGYALYMRSMKGVRWTFKEF